MKRKPFIFILKTISHFNLLFHSVFRFDQWQDFKTSTISLNRCHCRHQGMNFHLLSWKMNVRWIFSCLCGIVIFPDFLETFNQILFFNYFSFILRINKMRQKRFIFASCFKYCFITKRKPGRKEKVSWSPIHVQMRISIKIISFR